jgi:hypothetical protein
MSMRKSVTAISASHGLRLYTPVEPALRWLCSRLRFEFECSLQAFAGAAFWSWTTNVRLNATSFCQICRFFSTDRLRSQSGAPVVVLSLSPSFKMTRCLLALAACALPTSSLQWPTFETTAVCAMTSQRRHVRRAARRFTPPHPKRCMQPSPPAR